jgi:hypothetical protein
MRSFQQIVLCLFALLVCAFAQDTESYDATVYVTSTVYRVNTVTMSGSAPSSSPAANSTTTIYASHASSSLPSYPVMSSGKANGTAIGYPTGTSGPKPSASQFVGAASGLSVNVYVAALAAGVGYLVL